MFEFKLQVGCLILLLYFISNYVKDVFDRKVPSSPLFEGMLYIAPWAIIFDGLTAYTVNHMDTVPEWINVGSHGVFFVLMCIMTIQVFLYCIQQTMGIVSRKQMWILSIPGLISIALTILFMGELRFVIGETTNYSLGYSVYFCFVSLFLHFVTIFGIIIYHRRAIEKKKVFNLLVFMLIIFTLLVAQLLLPEILLTSLLPVLVIFGLYINFEDPSLRKIKIYNSDIMAAFATLVENRDDNTGGHINRTREYVSVILDEISRVPKFRHLISKDYYTNVVNAAPLHDIGKIATPDNILLKEGPLTSEEYETMKKHSKQGGEIIKKTLADLDDKEFQKIAYEMARYHHEKWDGKGYPDGMIGNQIPLHARIMAIADVFDAVSAKRCYRDALPLEECFKIIEEGRGTDFDPELVDLFLGAKDRITSYYEKCKVDDSDLKN